MSYVEIREVLIPRADEITAFADIQKLGEFRRATMELHSQLFADIDTDYHSPVSFYRSIAEQFIPESHTMAGLASEAGTEALAGVVNFSKKGKALELHEIIVAEHFRRHPELHVGSFMLSQIIEIARDEKVRTIELNSNLCQAAERFYEKFGFAKTSTVRRELSIR